MHVPSTLESQILAKGVHLTHMVSIAVPMMRLRVMMMTQIMMRIQRSERRSRVRANDVLLHEADRTEKNPANTAMKGMRGKFSGRIS